MNEHPDVQTIRRLMELAAQYGLEELRVSDGSLTVTLRAAPPPEEDERPGVNGGHSYLWTPPVWPEPEPAATRPEEAVAVAAPLTGTFYRSESPDAPNFVEIGDQVEEGQTIGLIEAMKVFSPIQADRAGTVLEIVVQNGRLVQHGEPLLYLLPA